MSATAQPLTYDSVVASHSLISPYIHRTPLLSSSSLSKLVSEASPPLPVEIYFKPECLQKTGSFKIRGATHALLRLPQSSLSSGNGVTTHSSGNHAAALTLAARNLGTTNPDAPGPIPYPIPAHIIMPSISTQGKINSVRGYGGQITFSGSTHAERAAVLAEVQARTNAMIQDISGVTNVDPSSPAFHVIITPCGGGGLLSGTALAASKHGVQVYGSEPSFQGADDCARGLKAGKRIEAVSTLTIADGLRTPVGVNNWKVISDPKYVKGVYSVGEEEIKKALQLVMERLKVVVEPSSAVPLAALLYNVEFRERLAKEFMGKVNGPIRVGIIISGGNITLERIGELFPKA
ncbi:hypothetical protein AX16_002799 [Volvariella volvacea WC 439]|nr:hypothetical protein AX16_002799 [Volvariella volvacea WC 439]